MKNIAVTLVLLFLLTYGCIVKGSEYFDRFYAPKEKPPEEKLFGWVELDNESAGCILPDNRVYDMAPEQVVYFPNENRINSSAYCQSLMKKYSEKVFIKKSIGYGPCDTLLGITDANWDKESKMISFTYEIEKPAADVYCADVRYRKDIWIAADYKEKHNYKIKTVIQEPFYIKKFPNSVKKKFEELSANFTHSSHRSVSLRTCKKAGDLVYYISWSEADSSAYYYFDAFGNSLSSSNLGDIFNNSDLLPLFNLEGYKCTIDSYLGPAFYNKPKT